MVNIKDWNVEDSQLWESVGKKVATRNLWISIPCLLLGFAVWLMWSIIIVQMEILGFRFDPDGATHTALLNTLPAIAGLAGATLRIPNSFLIAIGGGRNVIFTTTLLLLIPTIGVGMALQDINTPYLTFAILAALSGFGGGYFSSSMSNISFFFPKRVQGSSLGLNAGLGNVGVSVMQVLLPFTMGFAVFGALGGAGIPLPDAIGGSAAGTLIYIQNSGLTWVPILIVLVVASWFGMSNLMTVSPQAESTFKSIAKTLFLVGLGLVSAGVGLFLLLGLKWNMWLVLPITIVLTVVLMKYLSPGELKESLNRQFAIFNNKHNWIMTIIYTMTFGSFIGYSAAFPKLIQDVFGILPDGSLNPNAPNPFAYAWLGPLVGSLIRPVGGWVSDKVKSGSRVTHWTTVAMILAAIGVAFFVVKARESASPEEYFFPFLILFLILFVTTGIGNGSTFRSIPYIFEARQAGPVLGWTSAVAAYGAFLIPKLIGEQMKSGTPEVAMYGLAVFYAVCAGLNWWYYLGPKADIKNP
jgi:NNP family nitrate/nitrite transporter-like MFS transporter